MAVCSEPDGQYEFYGYVQRKDGTPYGTTEGEADKFDPGVLVENGTVYLYTGFNPPFPYEGNGINKPATGCEVTILEPDMITVRQEAQVVIPDCRVRQRGKCFLKDSRITPKTCWMPRQKESP